jgi:hypothetical protein
MKLQPLAIVLFLMSPPSAANSVCKPKKTSLGGRLPLPQAQLVSPAVSFFFPRPSFTLVSSHPVDYSNSKYPLTRLSPTQNCVAASFSLSRPIPTSPHTNS